jgi:pyruvate dehydrogenase kinase 2/3/4
MYFALVFIRIHVFTCKCRVIIADVEGNDDVCIKISDEGGGIPRGDMDSIWSYMYTTAPAPDTPDMGLAHTAEEADELFRPRTLSNYDYGDDAPMAGLGYGLSISRLFARYFGGDIDIKSCEGLGTDAYVHMRCLGDSKEPLP